MMDVDDPLVEPCGKEIETEVEEDGLEKQDLGQNDERIR